MQLSLSLSVSPVLNIYGLHCPLTSDLHVIAQDCISLRLSFVPFVLTHSTLLQPRATAGSRSISFHGSGRW